jgi:putative flippase GtrA
MDLLTACRREGTLIRGHVAVSLIGLGVDAALLYTSMGSGLSAPVARLISLFWAMQVTFVLNRFLVFRHIALGTLPRQWACYMATNGIGNFASYLVFVGLVASRAPLVSERYVALCVGALLAWCANYGGARLVAFRAAPDNSLRERVSRT